MVTPSLTIFLSHTHTHTHCDTHGFWVCHHQCPPLHSLGQCLQPEWSSLNSPIFTFKHTDKENTNWLAGLKATKWFSRSLWPSLLKVLYFLYLLKRSPHLLVMSGHTVVISAVFYYDFKKNVFTCLTLWFPLWLSIFDRDVTNIIKCFLDSYLTHVLWPCSNPLI